MGTMAWFRSKIIILLFPALLSAAVVYVPCDPGVSLNSAIMAQNSQIIYSQINQNTNQINSKYQEYHLKLQDSNKEDQKSILLKEEKIKILLEIIDIQEKLNEINNK